MSERQDLPPKTQVPSPRGVAGLRAAEGRRARRSRSTSQVWIGISSTPGAAAPPVPTLTSVDGDGQLARRSTVRRGVGLSIPGSCGGRSRRIHLEPRKSGEVYRSRALAALSIFDLTQLTSPMRRGSGTAKRYLLSEKVDVIDFPACCQPCPRLNVPTPGLIGPPS